MADEAAYLIKNADRVDELKDDLFSASASAIQWFVEQLEPTETGVTSDEVKSEPPVAEPTGGSAAQQVDVKPRLTTKDRKEREQAVSTYIRKQRKKDVPIEHITRDGIAKATGVPATAVSGTRAWVALDAEKKQAKAKPPPRAQSTTKDDDLLRGKAGDKIDAAIDRKDWEAVKKAQQREQRSQR